MKRVTDEEKEIIYKVYHKFIDFKNEREESPAKTSLQEFINFINY